MAPDAPRDEDGQLERDARPSRRARARTAAGARRHGTASTPRPRRAVRASSGRDDDARARPTPAASTSGRGSLWVNGRMRSVQPNGVSHSNHFVARPGVGDHAHDERDAEDAHAQAGGHAARATELRGDRADGDEHRGRDRDAQPVQHGLADAEPTSGFAPASSVISVVPTNTTPTAPYERGQRRGRGARRAGAAGQHELPAARCPPRRAAAASRRASPRSRRSS